MNEKARIRQQETRDNRTHEEIQQDSQYHVQYRKYNVESINITKQLYNISHREEINERDRIKYHTDIITNLRKKLESRFNHNVSSDIKHALRHYLKCDYNDLVPYFEATFQEGMTWKNTGSEWEIDHVIPIASFDLTIEENIHSCYHWSNLQSLFTYDNQLKYSDIYPEMIKKHSEFTLDYARKNNMNHPLLAEI